MTIPIGGAGSWGLTSPEIHPARGGGETPSPTRGAPDRTPTSASPPRESRPSGVEVPVKGRPPQEADPRLWALLTRSERDFYFRDADLGTVTYGPGHESGPPDAARRRLGGQVDLRA